MSGPEESSGTSKKECEENGPRKRRSRGARKRKVKHIQEIEPLEMMRNVQYQKPALYEKQFTTAYRVTFPKHLGLVGMVFMLKKVFLAQIPPELKSIRRNMEHNLRMIQRTIHPSIIRIYHIIVSNDQLFVLMPFYTLGSIDDFLANQLKGKPIEASQASCWFAQTLGPIKYLHDTGIAHRNIKLSSLLLKSELRPSIIVSGFGLNCEQYRQDYDIMRSTVVGQSAYRAPEAQALCSRIWPYDARAADMYALGVCFFRMVTGQYPYNPNLLHTNEVSYIYEQRQCSYTYPDGSTATDEHKNLIARLLEPTPGVRFTINYALMHAALDPE